MLEQMNRCCYDEVPACRYEYEYLVAMSAVMVHCTYGTYGTDEGGDNSYSYEYEYGTCTVLYPSAASPAAPNESTRVTLGLYRCFPCTYGLVWLSRGSLYIRANCTSSLSTFSAGTATCLLMSRIRGLLSIFVTPNASVCLSIYHRNRRGQHGWIMHSHTSGFCRARLLKEYIECDLAADAIDAKATASYCWKEIQASGREEAEGG